MKNVIAHALRRVAMFGILCALLVMASASLSGSMMVSVADEEAAVIHLQAITLDPALEYQMLNQLRQEGDRLNLTLDTETTMAFSHQVAQAWKQATDKGLDNMILLCDSRLRSNVAAMLARVISALPIVAYDEIVIGTEIEPIGTVSLDQTSNQEQAAMAVSS